MADHQRAPRPLRRVDLPLGVRDRLSDCFFSSRRRHTSWTGDWSSDVCSSDLARRDGKKGWPAWVAGREEQWRGIVYSDVIFAAGFAIFILSDFPPTQRFGLVVL